MLEEVLNKNEVGKRSVWHVLKDIELTYGEKGFGKLSIFGMEEILDKYIHGRFNPDAHVFYETYSHRFIGCEDEDKLIYSRHKFNKEIETGVIRYLK